MNAGNDPTDFLLERIMKRTTIIAAVALLATAGTASVLAAKGGWHEGRHHGWGHHHGGMSDFGFGGLKGAMRELRNVRSADADKDGAVTLDEYLKEKTADFTALDGNGDGVASGDELVADIVASLNFRTKAMLKQFDTNLDGKVTKDDFAARARQRFAERDINGDGIVDRSDMRPGRGGKWDRADDRAGEGDDDRGSDTALDADADAEDFDDEGRRGRRGRGRSASVDKLVERAERAFTRMDANNDGEINSADFAERHAAMIDFAKKRRLAALDKDRDGKVTADEYTAGPKDRFARFDLDGDGKITSADLPPRMAERWGKRKGDMR